MLLRRYRDVCTHVLGVCVNTEFDELKMNKTVSERIVLTLIMNYLETVILDIVFNVNVCTQGSPQY